MMFMEIFSGSKDLAKGWNALSGLTTGAVRITVSSTLTAKLTGSCYGEKAVPVIASGIYEIGSGATLTIPYSAEISCAKFSGTVSLSVSNGGINYGITENYQGKSFIGHQITGNVTVTRIEQETAGYTLMYPAKPVGVATYTITRTASSVSGITPGVIVNGPDQAGTVTVYPGDKLTISAAAATGYADPAFYLNSAGTISLTVSGNVTATVTAGANPWQAVWTGNWPLSDYYTELAIPSFDPARPVRITVEGDFALRGIHYEDPDENLITIGGISSGIYNLDYYHDFSDENIQLSLEIYKTSSGVAFNMNVGCVYAYNDLGLESNARITKVEQKYTAPYMLSYPAKPAGVQHYGISRNDYGIVYNPATAGTVTVYEGDDIKIYATPANGYLPPICTLNGNGTTLQVDGNITATVTAVAPQIFTLSYPAKPAGVASYTISRSGSAVQGANGTIVNNPTSAGTAAVYPGDKLTITATATNGYLTPEYGLNGNSTTLQVDGNVTATVTAVAPQVYTLSYPAKPAGVASYAISRSGSAVQGANGTLVNNPVSAGTAAVYPGDKLTITATAASGYLTPVYNLNGSGTTLQVTGNVTATVTAVAPQTYTLSYPAKPAGVSSYTISRSGSPVQGANGTVVNNPTSAGTAVIYAGDKLTITASAAYDYTSPTVGLNGLASLTVSANVEATVKPGVLRFSLYYPAMPIGVQSYTIKQNGVAIVSSPVSNGYVDVYPGDALTISAVPADDYSAPSYYLNSKGVTSLTVTGSVSAYVTGGSVINGSWQTLWDGSKNFGGTFYESDGTWFFENGSDSLNIDGLSPAYKTRLTFASGAELYCITHTWSGDDQEESWDWILAGQYELNEVNSLIFHESVSTYSGWGDAEMKFSVSSNALMMDWYLNMDGCSGDITGGVRGGLTLVKVEQFVAVYWKPIWTGDLPLDDYYAELPIPSFDPMRPVRITVEGDFTLRGTHYNDPEGTLVTICGISSGIYNLDYYHDFSDENIQLSLEIYKTSSGVAFNMNVGCVYSYNDINFESDAHITKVEQKYTAPYTLSYPAKPAGVQYYSINRNDYSIVYNPANAGTATVYAGDDIRIYAAAANGYLPPICNLNGNGTTLQVDGDVTVTVTAVVPQTYTLSYPAKPVGVASYMISRSGSAVQGANGTVVNNPVSAGTAAVYPGDKLTITATAANGYTSPTAGLNGSASLTVSSNVETTVKSGVQIFSLYYPATPIGVQSYTINRNGADIVNNPVSGGSVPIYSGDTLTISATAAAGYSTPSYYLNSAGVTSLTASGNVTAYVTGGAISNGSWKTLWAGSKNFGDSFHEITDDSGCDSWSGSDSLNISGLSAAYWTRLTFVSGAEVYAIDRAPWREQEEDACEIISAGSYEIGEVPMSFSSSVSVNGFTEGSVTFSVSENSLSMQWECVWSCGGSELTFGLRGGLTLAKVEQFTGLPGWQTVWTGSVSEQIPAEAEISQDLQGGYFKILTFTISGLQTGYWTRVKLDSGLYIDVEYGGGSWNGGAYYGLSIPTEGALQADGYSNCVELREDNDAAFGSICFDAPSAGTLDAHILLELGCGCVEYARLYGTMTIVEVQQYK